MRFPHLQRWGPDRSILAAALLEEVALIVDDQMVAEIASVQHTDLISL